MSFLAGAGIITISFIAIVVVIAEVIYLAEEFTSFNTEFRANGSGSYSQLSKLDWGTIKKIYSLNKSRWRYEKIVSRDGSFASKFPSLLYNTGDEWIEDRSKNRIVLPYKNKDEIIRVQLSFLDFIKFKCAKKFSKSKDLGSEMILTTAQEDIDKLRQKAMDQIKAAQDMMADALVNKNKEADTEPKLELFRGEQ